MKNNKEVVIFLIKVVKSSKFIIQLGNIAANAITLLNYYGYDFSYEDLSEIQIPGANLCGGRLMYTNFTKANLKSTIFDKSYTKQAQFDHSSLKNSSLTLKTQPIACKSLCIITTSIKSDELTDLEFFDKENIKFLTSNTAGCISISDDGDVLAYGITNFLHL